MLIADNTVLTACCAIYLSLALLYHIAGVAELYRQTRYIIAEVVVVRNFSTG